jgi:hypothetical protein
VRAAALALALLLALPARADTAPAEGRIVLLRVGEAAPYECGCVDMAASEGILRKRRACELERDLLRQRLESQPAPSPAGSTVALLLGALAVGVLTGIWIAK